ncbi:MAG: ABC transporter ATP-binding protein [Candidatus Enterosoma sp.]|nr:ABC transporter ATP-binding protein [Bacilli bacterium]MDD7607733.1 ABC transporter ATP-binding protein [bacterium]MDY5865855.1 ABC transporter ATP-binding protein [Candidatus Enterosoma sp.]
MNDVIVIDNLSKSYKQLKAVDDLSFRIKRGELFAFLGINGAGKSTTINIICGQLKKDQGKVYIADMDIDKNLQLIKHKIGVVFQNSLLDPQLSVKDNLQVKASLYSMKKDEIKKRVEYLAELLDFKSYINRPIGKLSGGQKRRIDIARALLHQPEILILDEPTTGLDPQTRKMMWNVINKLRKEKDMTVLLTTHYMEEASEADYVVIIDSGKKVAEGTPLELKNKYVGDYMLIYNTDEDKIKRLNLPYEKIPLGYRIEVKDTKEATELIKNNSDLFIDYELIKGKMDDVFLRVTGKSLEVK